MPVTYGWRPGSRVNLDAQKVGEAIARLQKARNEPLAPEDVVDAARSPKSVMHAHFEWDDTKAATAYRTEQARELVRSLTVEVAHSNIEPRFVRAHVNVQDDSGSRGYVDVHTAMSSHELRRQVIARAWTELEAWRQRHAELTELGRIFTMIDQGLPEPTPEADPAP